MAFSLTGAVYLFGFFALALLSFRLFQYRKREETTVSRLLFYFAGLLDLFFFVTALGSLFFAQNQEVLKGVVIIAAFLQGLAAAILGYLIVYLKIPRISPWFGFSAISVLALAAIAFTVVTPFFPRLEENYVINWGIQPFAKTLRFFVLSLVLFPMMLIFFKWGAAFQAPETRKKAMGLGFIFLMGLASGVSDFILAGVFNLGAFGADLSIFFLSVSILALTILTQNLPSSPYVKKIV